MCVMVLRVVWSDCRLLLGLVTNYNNRAFCDHRLLPPPMNAAIPRRFLRVDNSSGRIGIWEAHRIGTRVTISNGLEILQT